MAIISAQPTFNSSAGIFPCAVSVDTDDTLATVMGLGYLNGAGAPHIVWHDKLMCYITTSDSPVALLSVTLVGSDVQLVFPPK